MNTFIGRDSGRNIIYQSCQVSGMCAGEQFFSALTTVGYCDPVYIEMKDKAFEGSAADIDAAILTARNYLKQFIHHL